MLEVKYGKDQSGILLLLKLIEVINILVCTPYTKLIFGKCNIAENINSQLGSSFIVLLDSKVGFKVSNAYALHVSAFLHNDTSASSTMGLNMFIHSLCIHA